MSENTPILGKSSASPTCIHRHVHVGEAEDFIPSALYFQPPIIIQDCEFLNELCSFLVGVSIFFLFFFSMEVAPGYT